MRMLKTSTGVGAGEYNGKLSLSDIIPVTSGRLSCIGSNGSSTSTAIKPFIVFLLSRYS